MERKRDIVVVGSDPPVGQRRSKRYHHYVLLYIRWFPSRKLRAGRIALDTTVQYENTRCVLFYTVSTNPTYVANAAAAGNFKLKPRR